MRSVTLRRTPAADFSGFTMIELITVIVLLGILSAYVLPKLSPGASAGRDFFDNAVSAVRYAQKIAIAQHTTSHVCIEAHRIRVAMDNACATPVEDPGGGIMNLNSNDATISPTMTIDFDFEGIPNLAAQQRIDFVVGDITYGLCIEEQTGYSYPGETANATLTAFTCP